MAPTRANSPHQSFLYNQTDGAEVARGSSGDSQFGSGLSISSTDSVGSTVVTIAGSKAFEIRHRVGREDAGGSRANYGTEVYTRVEVWRA
jgi:hypothetical protein